MLTSNCCTTMHENIHLTGNLLASLNLALSYRFPTCTKSNFSSSDDCDVRPYGQTYLCVHIAPYIVVL